jgi:prefoldin subunit 5
MIKNTNFVARSSNEVIAFYAAHRQEIDASIAAEQIIEPITRRRYSLEELVEAIAPENLHMRLIVELLWGMKFGDTIKSLLATSL